MDPLTAFGIFMTVAGTAEKIFGASRKAADARSIAEKNAQAAEEAAADVVGVAGTAGVRARMRGGNVLGAQTAEFAAGNVVAGVGSAGTTAQKTQMMTDLDEQILRNNATREAWGYRKRATMFRREGALQAEAAGNEGVASLIGGIGQVAGVAGRAWAGSPDKFSWAVG